MSFFQNRDFLSILEKTQTFLLWQFLKNLQRNEEIRLKIFNVMKILIYSGHNFPLPTLAKTSTVLGEPIISVEMQ